MASNSYFVGNPSHAFHGFEHASIEDVAEWLRGHSVIGLDIETSRRYSRDMHDESNYIPGLDPWLSRIIMLQIGDLITRFVIDTRVVDITPILPYLEDPNKLYVGTNLVFEYTHLLVNYGVRLRKVWDTMIVDMCLWNGYNYKFSLEEQAKRYLKVRTPSSYNLFNSLPELAESVDELDKEDEQLKAQGYYDRLYEALKEEETFLLDKATRMQFINIGDKPFTDAQVRYGEDDIILPLKIREIQLTGRSINTWDAVGRGYVEEVWNPQRLLNLENEALLVLGDIRVAGIPFVKKDWVLLAEQAEVSYLETKAWLNEYVKQHAPEAAISLGLFQDADVTDWKSAQKVVEVFKKLGIAQKAFSKSTGRESWTVGADTLEKLLKKNPKHKEFIKKYLQLKELQLKITTFGTDYLKYVHPITGRIHPNFRQILNTGRMAALKPNVQQIPSDKEYRACVRSEKGAIISCDYDSQEIYVLANASKDTTMLQFLNSGKDFHASTATTMFRIIRNEPDLLITAESSGKGELKEDDPSYSEEHVDLRTTAKSMSFRMNYGAGDFSISEELNVSQEEAADYIAGYFATYPQCKKHFERGHDFILKNGYVVINTVTDRRYFYPYFQEMKKLKELYFSAYPPNYRELSPEEKDVVKDYANRLYGKEIQLARKMEGQMKRRSQNYPIQGTSGDMTKTAAILIRREMLERGLYDRMALILLVHDEIDAEAFDAAFKDESAQLLSEKMTKAGRLWCKDAQITATYKVAEYWKH